MANEKKPMFTEEPQSTIIESNQVEMYEDIFTVINHNGIFMIAVGNQVVCKERFATREEALHYIDCKPWSLILNTVAVMVDKLQTLNNKQ